MSGRFENLTTPSPHPDKMSARVLIVNGPVPFSNLLKALMMLTNMGLGASFGFARIATESSSSIVYEAEGWNINGNDHE